MSEYLIRPLSDRTPFGNVLERDSVFTVTWGQVVDLLSRELDYLDAKNVVLELDVTEQEIRNDGTLRARVTPRSRAVRIAFGSSQGPLTFATDMFVARTYKGMRDSWRHNVYAIAMSLERLRKVEDYGVIRRGEQYVGLKALPAGRAMPASHMTGDEAEQLLFAMASSGDEERLRGMTMRQVLREARFHAHPDRNAGDQTLWDQVELAAAVLRLT